MTAQPNDLGVSYHNEREAMALAAALREAGREYALFDLGAGKWAIVTLIPAMQIFPPLGAHEALHHIDGDPLNNDLSNLRVVDIRENRRGKPDV
jgi:hypothetical protein